MLTLCKDRPFKRDLADMISPRIRTIAAALLVLLLFLGFGSYSAAADSQSIPFGIAPVLLGQGLPIAMSSLQVDAALHDVAGRTELSVQCTYRLRNLDPSRRIEFQLGFPLRQDASPAFDLVYYHDVSLKADGREVQLEPPTATRPFYVLGLSLGGEGRTRLDLSYTLDLGDGPVTELRYFWGSASEWDGVLESARITVHLPSATTPEPLLETDPAPKVFDGQAITWDGESFEPTGEIRLLVISPGIWREIATTRQAIAAGSETAEQHYRLASLYWQLGPPEQASYPEQLDLYTEILGHLLEAQQLDPGLVSAYLDAASLYLARADEEAQSAHHYLGLATQALEAALEQEPGDTVVRQRLVDTYVRLGIATRQRGDYQMACLYFNKALEATHSQDRVLLAEDVEQEIETTYMAWVASLLSQGQVEEALEIVAQQIGEDPVPTYGSYRPPSVSLRGQIRMSPNERQGRFVFVTEGQPSIAIQALQELVASIDSVEGCAASLSTEAEELVLTATISFENPEELATRLGAIESLFPRGADHPWLVFVRSALIPSSVWIAQAEIPMVMDGGYRETIDLVAPAAALDAARERTNWAIMDLQGQAPESEREEALRAVSLGLLQKYARLWQRQRDETRIDYEASFASSFAPAETRRWSLRLGQTDQLRFEVRQYDRPVIIRVIATAVVILGLVLWLLDVMRQRRRSLRRG